MSEISLVSSRNQIKAGREHLQMEGKAREKGKSRKCSILHYLHNLQVSLAKSLRFRGNYYEKA